MHVAIYIIYVIVVTWTRVQDLPDMYARAQGLQARGQVHTCQVNHEVSVLQLLCNTMYAIYMMQHYACTVYAGELE